MSKRSKQVVLTISPEGFAVQHGCGLSRAEQQALFAAMVGWFDSEMDIQSLGPNDSSADRIIASVNTRATTWKKTVVRVLKRELGRHLGRTLTWKVVGVGR